MKDKYFYFLRPKDSLSTMLVWTKKQLHHLIVKSQKSLNKQTVYAFINAINEHNIENIELLMTRDHKFIDANGNEIVGKEKMKVGWHSYFQLFPDYKIEITDIFSRSDTFAVFGFASATFMGKHKTNSENSWRLPASWRAVVFKKKIRLWQVYADTRIPYYLI